ALAPAHRASTLRQKGGFLVPPACETLSIRWGGHPCPNCGWEPNRPGEFIATAEGELGLVQGGRAKANAYGPFERAEWHAMLTAVAVERGYKPGWAGHKYREKFGDWPQRRHVPPVHPARRYVTAVKPTPDNSPRPH